MSKATPQLHIQWEFGSTGAIESGVITLSDHHSYSMRHAKLCLSGMVRITDQTPVSGAVLHEYVSNVAVFVAEAGNVPSADKPWQINVGEPDYPMRHYSEGIVNAYLAMQDGTLVDVPVMQTAQLMDGTLIEPKALLTTDEVGNECAHWCITPYPNDIELEGSAHVPTSLLFDPNSDNQHLAVTQFKQTAAALFPEESWYTAATDNSLKVRFKESPEYRAERYRLVFNHTLAEITAASATGYLYGLITLGQLLRARITGACKQFPITGTINDQPAHDWRGCHLDVARQFYRTKTIKQFLHVLAWNKLNRFHWHLSDDEAWRVEIKALPQLTEIGAWRGHGLPIPPVLGNGYKKQGGFYTQHDISDVVSTATKLGIIVVPELDMPGHCFAVLQSLTGLADPHEPPSYRSLQGFTNNCLNPVREQTYQFIEQVLDELLPLFPSRVWHVGADEVPDTAWLEAPSVKHSAQVLSSRHLQATFLKRLHGVLKDRGVTTGAWQEAAQETGIDTDQSYLVAWLDTSVAKELATTGYNVVVSAGQAYYLDMAMADSWAEPGLAWAGSVSVSQTYAFDPTEGWSDELRTKCKGVQACIWSEQMTNTTIFDYLVFPRLSAVAETAWTHKHNKDWNRFSSQCHLMPRLFNA